MCQRRLLSLPKTPIRSYLIALSALALFGWGTITAQPAAVPSARTNLAPSETPPVQVLHDLVYRDLRDGEDAGLHKNKLDIYIPRGKKDFPVIFFVHGGAWLHGNKNQFGMYSALALSWARHGIGTVSINYRLSPGVKHPQHVKDVARAFAWTRKHIAEYGGRADQIFVCGHSAGGHLVALLATDEKYLQAEGLSLKDIRGAIPISGVYRIHDVQINAGIPLPRGARRTGSANGRDATPPFSSVFGSDANIRRDASPLIHVKPGIPPFLVLYADHDLMLLPEMAREFDSVLKRQQCAAQTLEINKRDHMSILLNITQEGDPAGQAILEFIAKHTKP
jgi:acetyl esterase/lipase